MAHTRAWSNTNPAASDKAGLGYQDLNQFRVDVDERLQQTHVFGSSQTADGEHKYDKTAAHGNSGATHTIDLDDGGVQTLTLTANCTLTFSVTTAPPSGYARSLTLIVTQDGTGGRTITWPSSVKWPFDVTPSPDTTASTVSIFQFYTLNGGTRWYGSYVGSKYTA